MYPVHRVHEQSGLYQLTQSKEKDNRMLLPAILCEGFWEPDCCNEWGQSIPLNACTSHDTDPLVWKIHLARILACILYCFRCLPEIVICQSGRIKEWSVWWRREQSGTRGPGVQEDVKAKEEHLGRDLASAEVSGKVFNRLLPEFQPWWRTVSKEEKYKVHLCGRNGWTVWRSWVVVAKDLLSCKWL